MKRDARKRYTLVAITGCILAFLLPSLVILALGNTLLTEPVVPDLIVEPRQSDLAVNLLLELAKIMISISIGLAVAALWFFRRPLRKNYDRFANLTLIGVLVSSMASIYCGLRFLFDVATQLQYVTFNFEPLSGRLYAQGFFVLIQVSFLCLAGSSWFFFHDRRFNWRKN